MNHLNQADKVLTESLNVRLQDADALSADDMLFQIEKSDPYLNPSYENHAAYLVMRSQIIGRQIELSGRNPFEVGNNANSSMLDNQRFHHDGVTHDDEPDFAQEYENFFIERKNVSNYLLRLQKGEAKDVASEDLPTCIEATQKQLINMDMEQAGYVKTREAELERVEELEISWESEAVAKRTEMKKDFMKNALKNVLPINQPEAEKLAQAQWARLQSDFGM